VAGNSRDCPTGVTEKPKCAVEVIGHGSAALPCGSSGFLNLGGAGVKIHKRGAQNTGLVRHRWLHLPVYRAAPATPIVRYGTLCEPPGGKNNFQNSDFFPMAPLTFTPRLVGA
jgi:hypothetical protein